MLPQSCTMIATTLIIVLAQTLVGVSSLPQGDKISRLPGQPPVNFQQYSGYIPVDDQQQRALFYYFAEAEVDPTSKPLVLWLNGGPGCSSFGVGAFTEHGPFKPSENVLLKNDYSWNKEANVIYLESPAGVGFSYSTNKSFYTLVTDETTARDNLVFLKRWFTEFPEYSNNEFFITGESYGGHYVPQLAQLIVETKTKINLKGIAIGNPLLEFNTDFNSRGEYFWSHGLISDSTYEDLTRVCNYSQIQREQQIQNNLSRVCATVNKLLSTEISNYTDEYDVTLDVCLSSVGQQAYVLNQLQETAKIDVCVGDKTFTYLNRKEVQEALHAKLVGVTTWSTCSQVLHYDYRNLEIPTIPILGSLVKSGIRVLVYSGDQDSVIPLLGTRSLVNWLAKEIGLSTTVAYRAWFQGKQVNTWNAIDPEKFQYYALPFHRTFIFGIFQIAGWTQVYGNILSYATIRGASHEAPFSQPERSLVLFTAFLEGKPLPSII